MSYIFDISLTDITSGKVHMNGQQYTAGDIIINPGETIDFYCKEAAMATVIKITSIKNDKFIIKN